MVRSARVHAWTGLQLPERSYVYQILPVRANLAVSSSDDSIRILDPASLQMIADGVHEHVHQGITALASSGPASSSLLSAGRDARVQMTDLRLRSGDSVIRLTDTDNTAAYLSLASTDTMVAAGTEMSNSQATVSIWDIRSPDRVVRRYVECHNDDVTELVFHPVQTHILLSGATDALLNVIDISQTEEDDALLSITNHRSSINHTGFITPQHFYALSHDEQFSIYKVESTSNITNPVVQSQGSQTPPSPSLGVEVEVEVSQSKKFGDVRSLLDCEYVVDLVNHAEGPVLAAGSHSTQSLTLIPLTNAGGVDDWVLGRDDAVRLEGAHGEEIVRSVYCDPAGSIFSGGEDGQVKAWQVGDDGNGNRGVEAVKTPSKGRKDERRFKPY